MANPLSKAQIYAMALGDDAMDLLNQGAF